MPRPERTTHIDCEIIGGTELAVQIKTDDDIYWVPRSVITNEDEIPERGHSNVHIQTWFVEKEEIH